MEHIWYCDETDSLHVSMMGQSDLMMWLMFDPQSIERARDQAEPSMIGNFTFSYIGEL